MVVITSHQNPVVKAIAGLQRAGRTRRRSRRTVVEGFRTLRRAHSNGWVVPVVLFSSARLDDADAELLARCEREGSRVQEVSEPVLARLSSREGPLGCVAEVVWEDRFTLETLPLSTTPLLLVAQAVEKPGTLGVLIRTATGAGADAVVVCEPLASLQDPACIHASLGSVFETPWVVTSSDRCLHWLDSRGIAPVGTSPRGERLYTEWDLTQPVAVAVGNEHVGLSPEWMAQRATIRIDLDPSMESLNTTVASGIVLFEAVRQRRLRRDMSAREG